MRPTAARERGPAWRVETIHETASTNDLVLERARKGEAGGLVVRAISQTRGRGRRGRAWFSPPGGGLYFSALLRPVRRTEVPQAITLLLGVAVAEGIDRNAQRAFLERHHLAHKTECHTCWARPLCSGGCYHEAHTRYGTSAHPNLHYCEWIRGWTDVCLRVYGELAERNPGYLRRFD